MSSQVTVTLANESTWMEQFPNMEVMARGPKPLCPEVAVNVTGLDPDDVYSVHLSIERHSDKRFTCTDNVWTESTVRKAKPGRKSKQIEHDDGVQKGHQWMLHTVKFDHVRVSSNDSDKEKKHVFYVDTMHKYRPEITITNINTKTFYHFILEQAQFIPVSVYARKEMGQFKAKINKYTTRKNGGLAPNKRGRKVEAEEKEQPMKKMKTDVPIVKTARRSPSGSVTPNTSFSTTTSSAPSGSSTPCLKTELTIHLDDSNELNTAEDFGIFPQFAGFGHVGVFPFQTAIPTNFWDNNYPYFLDQKAYWNGYNEVFNNYGNNENYYNAYPNYPYQY